MGLPWYQFLRGVYGDHRTMLQPNQQSRDIRGGGTVSQSRDVLGMFYERKIDDTLQ